MQGMSQSLNPELRIEIIGQGTHRNQVLILVCSHNYGNQSIMHFPKQTGVLDLLAGGLLVGAAL